jgi:hypothetical protein
VHRGEVVELGGGGLPMGSERSVASARSVLSGVSAGSILSVASAGSILSIGSTGSILSIGSSGSILSIGSVGSVLSVGSFCSALSRRSAFAILGRNQFGGIGPKQDQPEEVALKRRHGMRVVTSLVLAAAVGALIAVS